MARDWKSTNVLVTGGGSGIGLGITKTLLRAGAQVTIAGRSEQRLTEAKAQVADDCDLEASQRLHTVVADVSVEADVEAAVAKAASVTGELNAVVANAGEPRGQMAPVTHLNLDEWQSIFNNNVVGSMLTLKHGGRELVKAGGGSFVAVSSVSAVLTARFAGPISAAKAAIEQLIRIGAHELGASNVRVNAVRPGLVEVERQGALPDQMRDDFLSIIPMGRLGSPNDMAGAVKFLVGPDSEWLTGQVFSVDGGMTMVRAFDASPWVEGTFTKDQMRGVV